jgi:hypothetical protein
MIDRSAFPSLRTCRRLLNHSQRWFREFQIASMKAAYRSASALVETIRSLMRLTSGMLIKGTQP